MKLHQLEDSITSFRRTVFKYMRLAIIFFAGIVIGLIVYLHHTRRKLKRTKKQEQVVTITKDKMEGELLVARKMQESMLHHDVPTDSRYELAADLQPALQVSGDLYDFIQDGSKLHFIVADISGKGLSASLYMTVTTCTFRTVARLAKEPSDTLQSINQLICANNANNIFITALAGTLDLKTGELKLCSAGHNLPIILNPNATKTSLLPQTLRLDANLPLGIIPGCVYKNQTTYLTPGATLFMYTDGITEAANHDFQLFGDARLEEALVCSSNTPPQRILENCLKAVENHVNGVPRADDITMMAIKFNGSKN